MGGMVDDTLGTNIFGKNSMDKAMGAIGGASEEAKLAQEKMYLQQREDYKPWQQAGLKALAGLEDPNFGKNMEMDPGYQFRLNEGNKGINAAAAARGMGNSGATLKALARFGQDHASNEYGRAYDRAFGRLNTLAGYGSNATSNMAQAAQNYGNAFSGITTSAANAMAGGHMAQGEQNRALFKDLVKGGASIIACDERLKTNIEEVSKEDLKEMRQCLKPYLFNYINEKHGTGDWIGVMAQDLEKSKLGKTIVIEDENGNKMIDVRKAACLALAVIAEG